MQIIKKSYIWFILSGTLTALSICVLIFTKLSHGSFMYYGIDFTGGTLMEIQFQDKNLTLNKVNDSIKKYSEFTPQVQPTDSGFYIIKMKTITNEQHDEIINTLKEKNGSLEEIRFITIGPSIGKTLKNRAFLALIIALTAIVIYLAFAFREMHKRLNAWKFGMSAIIALIHDVITTMGIFTFIGIFYNAEVDALFITAILTIIGFSVHDTIVTFDRIRENFKFARPTETFADISEASIQQTLTRSINTSLATLFPLISLCLFGAESIKMFVITLTIGIIAGTYSSIFIATPILVKWQGDKDIN